MTLGYSQEIDSLILVKKSIVSYCAGKVEQVSILNERVLVKDKEIKLADTRLKSSQQDVSLWIENADAFRIQRDAAVDKLGIKTTLADDTEQKNKSLKRQNTGLKIGVVILIAGIIYEKANN